MNRELPLRQLGQGLAPPADARSSRGAGHRPSRGDTRLISSAISRPIYFDVEGVWTLPETRTDVADAFQRARDERGAAIISVIESGLLEDLERLRQDCVFLALKPFAAPRLPDDVLRCFDAYGRQIRPLPEQVAERARRTRPGLLIPAPRKPGEVVRAWPR